MLGLPAPGLGYRLNNYDQHLAFLRRQGYETALAGVQHVAHAPWAIKEEVLPYDHFLTHTRRPTFPRPRGIQISWRRCAGVCMTGWSRPVTRWLKVSFPRHRQSCNV